jgi:sepiapterin reductase
LATEEKQLDKSPDLSTNATTTVEYDANDDTTNSVATTITQVRVLNYAPGPLETDMSNELRSSESLDPSLKPMYQQKLVDPADSAAVLVHLVLEAPDLFESGSHIDYYEACQWIGKC